MAEGPASWVSVRTDEPAGRLGFDFLAKTLGLPVSGPPGESVAIDAIAPGVLQRIGDALRWPRASSRWDDHGRLRPEGILHEPVVDRLAQEVLATVRGAFERRGSPLVRIWPWRHGRPFGVALSHDVDLHRKWRARTALSYAFRRGDFRGIASRIRRRPDPWWTFDTILELERRAAVRSTFFLAAGGDHPEDPTYRIENPQMRNLARYLQAGGWEVALHGSYRASADDQLIQDEKRRFERATGLAVDTYRQHYLRFHGDSPKRIQAAGFRYDSSLGTEYTLGFLTGVSVPHTIDGLLELPVSLMDTCFQPASDVNRVYGTQAERETAVRDVLGNIRDVHGLAVVDWHQNYFDEEAYPGFRRLYERILEETRGADRGGVREIARWWEARAEARLRAEEGRWKVSGRDLPAGLTIAVAGGRLQSGFPTSRTEAREEGLYALETLGPWDFSVE